MSMLQNFLEQNGILDDDMKLLVDQTKEFNQKTGLEPLSKEIPIEEIQKEEVKE